MSTVGAVSTCSPYLQFRNVSLVTRECGACEQSKVLSVAAAFLIESYAARWLLVEFSSANLMFASALPFPTARLGTETRVLVLKLPAHFDFQYHPEHRACRWISSGDRMRLFSLMFLHYEDYDRMQRVMSVIRKRPVCMITSTAPIMTQASSAMKEMFRQLDVDRMPIVEEEGEPDA